LNIIKTSHGLNLEEVQNPKYFKFQARLNLNLEEKIKRSQNKIFKYIFLRSIEISRKAQINLILRGY